MRQVHYPPTLKFQGIKGVINLKIENLDDLVHIYRDLAVELGMKKSPPTRSMI
jgi:hypothetical protein